MNNLWNPDLYLKAWHFATHAHEGQTYGGPEDGMKIPYINHIGGVAMEVMLALAHSTQPYDGNLTIQCALLHDVIEDTAHTYDDIVTNFGLAVAGGASALSKDKMLPTKSAQVLDSPTNQTTAPRSVDGQVGGQNYQSLSSTLRASLKRKPIPL